MFYSLLSPIVKFIEMTNHQKVILIMGASGSGKTTIGRLLSRRLNIPFYDGDDFHPESNILKMKSGQPLNDADRWPWLERILIKIEQCRLEKGCIFACSALKEKYRAKLGINNSNNNMVLIHLYGSKETLFKRIQNRADHFFTESLLDSQLEALEEPEYGIKINIDDEPVNICNEILKQIVG